MICISLGNRIQVEQVINLKPDMVEVRLDLLGDDAERIFPFFDDLPPVIATCRPGNSVLKERIRLMKMAIDRGVSYIDIELDADHSYYSELKDYADLNDTGLIISWHDFQKTPTPGELEKILGECYNLGADIAKIACQVNSLRDNANLLSLYSREGRKVILGMGELGKITRFAATRLGAEFTFVATDSDHATAPGQLTFDDFNSLNKIFQEP